MNDIVNSSGDISQTGLHLNQGMLTLLPVRADSIDFSVLS